MVIVRESAREAPRSLTDLARLAGAGSAQALDHLLRRVEGPLYRYLAGRLLATPDAEDLARDLCQEALVRAMTSIGRCSFASDGRLMAWVLTIARNVLLDHLREARGRAEVRGDDLWEATASAGPLSGEDSAPPCLLETFITEAVADVPETTAELLRLRAVDGMSWKEVAGALGITETAAKRRYQRAQGALRRRILARVEALPADARGAAVRRLLPPGAGVPPPDDTEPGGAAGRDSPCPAPQPTEKLE